MKFALVYTLAIIATFNIVQAEDTADVIPPGDSLPPASETLTTDQVDTPKEETNTAAPGSEIEATPIEAESTPASSENEAPEAEKAVTETAKTATVIPEKPKGPKRLKFPAVDNVLIDPPLPSHPVRSVPKSMGDTTGDVFIAHRHVAEKYNGWGWVKHESESWRSAQWVAIREQLGDVIVPGRHLKHPNNDHNVQYRFYGKFSSEQACEPNKDIFVAVFDLKGFEVIGPASKPSGVTLPKSKTNNATRSKPTSGGARSNPFRR